VPQSKGMEDSDSNHDSHTASREPEEIAVEKSTIISTTDL
jgi:hypothetical protein